MALAEQQGAQQTVGEFLGNLRHHWNKPKLLQQHFTTFQARGPPAAEVTIATAVSSIQGAFLGGVMGSFAKVPPGAMDQMTSAGANPEMQRQMQAMQQGGPWVQARNFAVFSGVNACISTGMRRWRKKEDVRNVLVSGFGSGVAFTLISGMAPSVQAAFTSGVLMALCQGAFYKVGQRFSGGGKSPEQDLQYARARVVLASLGLSAYEKNIRKGQLNDSTMWLWNDRALKEVRIPPGPRLVLLHHVDRYNNLLKQGVLPPPPQAQFMAPLPGPPQPGQPPRMQRA